MKDSHFLSPVLETPKGEGSLDKEEPKEGEVPQEGEGPKDGEGDQSHG